VTLADRDDLRGALDELGIPLEAANPRLRALGLPPLHNPDGQARQLSAYLQQNRAARRNTIRDRFALARRPGEPLTDYLTLLEAVPEPDPAWLDRYWDLPADVLASHVDSWLAEASPVGDDIAGVRALPPIDELREAGARTITSVLPNARALVEAWLHRNRAGEGACPGERAAVTESMIAEGLLDFGRLTAAEIIGWLHDNGQWPDGMRLTTSRADLGLTEQDLEDARSRLDQGREQQRRKAAYVQYGITPTARNRLTFRHFSTLPARTCQPPSWPPRPSRSRCPASPRTPPTATGEQEPVPAGCPGPPASPPRS
jgi:hypothetical protein